MRSRTQSYPILFLPLIAVLATTIAQANDLDFLLKQSSGYDDVLVKEVRSVNRFVIQNQDMKHEVIRLIGLKGPEKKNNRPTEPVERDEYGFRIQPELDPESPVEEKALNYVINLIDQKRVRLEFDRDKADDDYNTLAYVFLKDDDETFVNAEILRQGFAQLQNRPPNTKYKSELRAAYKEGRAELRGLHGQ